MLCYLFACRLEDEMIAIGVELPKHKSIIQRFPPLRLIRNITAINHYIGFDVSRLILKERVYAPIKKDVRSGFVVIQELLGSFKMSEKGRISSAFHVLDIGVYEFRKSFRKSLQKSRERVKK